jgi:hypothetical protein
MTANGVAVVMASSFDCVTRRFAFQPFYRSVHQIGGGSGWHRAVVVPSFVKEQSPTPPAILIFPYKCGIVKYSFLRAARLLSRSPAQIQPSRSETNCDSQADKCHPPASLLSYYLTEPGFSNCSDEQSNYADNPRWFT